MRPDEYCFCEPEHVSDAFTLSRREMLKVLGGITIIFTAGEPLAAMEESLALAQQRRGGRYPDEISAYLHIGEAGRVNCYSGKIEMGQGIITSLAQMLADELDVSLDSVDMVMGDTALCPRDMATVGSLSTRQYGPALRRAGAAARALLIELAAEHLGASQDRLAVEDGVVFDQDDPGKRVSYAELARGKQLEHRIEASTTPKGRSELRICGKGASRADAEVKVTGLARYCGDIRVPGMLYARILRPPMHGATLEHVDTSAAEEIDGVRVVRDGDLVAVLHEYPDVAERALARIEARYSEPERTVDNSNIFEHLESLAPEAETFAAAGDLDEGRRLAVKTFEVTYLNHYVAHAPIEPHTALVQLEGDRATVWASTQAPFWVQGQAAEALGIPAEDVRVITPFVGGGFGGKASNRQVTETARLAKLAGRPVQVAWTRQEEFFYDTFRPAAVVKVKSGFDRANRVVYWDYDNLFGGSRSSEPVYHIPHHRVLSRGSWGGGGHPAHPFSVGAWRAPASNTNVFAMEQQMDIMAQAAGKDPLSFRFANLVDERMRRVVEAAAEKFGREWAVAPSGRGHGLAITDYHDTYVATMAEVEVDRATGAVKVKRVVCAQDTGEVINPDGVRLQIEGCITMGLGYVLSEEVRFNGGEVLDKDFDTYKLPRFSWVPQIETVLVDNQEMPPSGCGEPAITPMGAVIANAVYDAIGVRTFVLPMTAERILRALRES
ncbi:MAG: xanthine dehydrogenase family protein molybdopterin-binding subunit [Gemmatimonadota bacterium]|nr:MAG: xanthine dehydrogenase family protein molybdopterin-binding subunit [Gemmatimonadota bacterium]